MAELPASRWTSAPPLPPMAASVPAVMVTAAAPEPLSFWVEAPAAPIATVLSAPLPSPEAVEAAVPSWTQEWESVAALPTTSGGATALHTAVTVALEAVFGAPAPEPAAVQPLAPPPVVTALTALDLPLPADVVVAETPLAAQASAFLSSATPPTPMLAAVIPPPPTSPPRTLAVPAPAQQIVDRAVRTAPSTPVQRRSTVRLGFTDASVVDLRPDDPMAKALHTVADALIGREAF